MGIRSLLQGHEGREVCGEAADGREAVAKTAEIMPDLVIVDLGMSRLNGLDAARQILHDNPQQQIVILTSSDSEQMMRAALGVGVAGEGYSIGFYGPPVSFVPYLDDLAHRLTRQYRLTFLAWPEKKAGMQQVKVVTEVQNAEISSADRVYVPMP